MSTTLPRRSAEERVCPSMSLTENSGMREPTSPAAIVLSFSSEVLECCRQPTTTSTTRQTNDVLVRNVYSFFCTSMIVRLKDVGSSDFFLPGGFLYSWPRKVTNVGVSARDSNDF